MSDEINYEQEARQQGWVPKEDFRGNENEWVSAEDFVERGRQILPILRANYDRLKKETTKEREQHQRELDEVKKTAAEFKEFQKEAFERKKKEFDSELARLRSEKARAISDGDGDRVAEIEDKIDDIKEQKASAKPVVDETPPVQLPKGVDPALQTWVDKHSEWFGVNKRATAMANALASELRESEPNLTGSAFLNKLDQLLEDDEDVSKFLGKQKRQSPVSSSTTGSSRSSGGKKQSYENLPKEAKDACDRYVKQKLMTREEYVESYDWN